MGDLNVVGGRRPRSWQWSHLVMSEVRRCWHCDKPTRFVQPDFQTWLHPGECTEAKWREYDLANQALPPAPGEGHPF